MVGYDGCIMIVGYDVLLIVGYDAIIWWLVMMLYYDGWL